jgi:hypothetical protein
MTYKYVDGKLIETQHFKWTSSVPPAFGINLAIGSSDTVALPGLIPNSLSEFPAVLSIEYISGWAK